MHILGYTYEADVHCVNCAAERFGRFGPAHNVEWNRGYGFLETLSDGSTIELDENHIPIDEKDNEGNPIHPMFSLDNDIEYCGDCHDEL